MHLAVGQPGAPSLGTTVTSIGALLLALSVLVLVLLGINESILI